ncbi:MAG: tRNA (cytidine(34)-2'-O)-methyltransferase [Acidobacteria bacterium]|nr:tRNA (cytidine(34)-2'-O)-methyltransferase [Acidobacteriota bacterium]
MSSELLHVVLVEPEIHPNTGNIARLCAATKTRLHLVEPLGFRVDEKSIKRAGLDYWPYVDLHKHINFATFQETIEPTRCWYFTTKAKKSYVDVDYKWGDALIFGPETRGLPKEILETNLSQCIKIPMLTTHVRSLNLATATAIALYEALRQLGQLALLKEDCQI